MSALFSVSFPMFYMYNPNTIFVKSVLACVSRSLLAQLKCEHLTSRPDVDSFVERGVDLADLESLMELPPGGYCVPPRHAGTSCGPGNAKSALGGAVDGQIWVLVQLGNDHCRMASMGTQLISLTKEAKNGVCWGERTSVLCRE